MSASELYDHPVLGFDQGVPIGINFTHVLKDTLIVSDMDADGNELRMTVDPDTVGLEDLNFNTLVPFRSDNNFGTGSGYVDRHNKITPE